MHYTRQQPLLEQQRLFLLHLVWREPVLTHLFADIDEEEPLVSPLLLKTSESPNLAPVWRQKSLVRDVEGGFVSVVPFCFWSSNSLPRLSSWIPV